LIDLIIFYANYNQLRDINHIFKCLNLQCLSIAGNYITNDIFISNNNDNNNNKKKLQFLCIDKNPMGPSLIPESVFNSDTTTTTTATTTAAAATATATTTVTATDVDDAFIEMNGVSEHYSNKSNIKNHPETVMYDSSSNNNNSNKNIISKQIIIPFKNLIVLQCRNCHLESLNGLQYLPLQKLYADNNNIINFDNTLLILKTLSNLKHLVLVGNPVVSEEYYNINIIINCKMLDILDHYKVQRNYITNIKEIYQSQTNDDNNKKTTLINNVKNNYSNEILNIKQIQQRIHEKHHKETIIIDTILKEKLNNISIEVNKIHNYFQQ
jgi:hypothetical protein